MADSDAKFPAIIAQARRAFVAPPERIMELLDKSLELSVDPEVHRIEVLEPGKRIRLHDLDMELHTDIDFSWSKDGDGNPLFQTSFTTPTGLTLTNWTVRTTKSATVVEARAILFVQDPAFHDQLDEVTRGLEAELNRCLDGFSEMLDPSTRPMSDPSRAPQYVLKFRKPALVKGNTPREGSKYGGQPVWIGEPQWPIVRKTGGQMTFVMQIELPESHQLGGHQMAYVFIDAAEDQEVYPCDAEGGHNAVILQGGTAFEPHVIVGCMATGPTLRHRDKWQYDEPETQPPAGDVEGAIRIATAEPGDEFPEFAMIGQPVEWLQNDETPAGGPWRLVLQADSEHFPCWVPFEGYLYVFIAEDGRKARVLYQFT